MFLDLLHERLAGICSLTPVQANLLQKHYEMLVKWNQKLNLTSVRNEAEMVDRHYCESIFLATHLPQHPVTIADIGSGAGFPGFPLAVLRPDCAVTLIESHQRKAVFLRESSREQTNVRVLAKRAEDVGEQFDWAVSRAVRYSDVASTLPKVARHCALLTGDVRPEELVGFEWKPAIQLPWGERRFLFVSRET